MEAAAAAVEDAAPPPGDAAAAAVGVSHPVEEAAEGEGHLPAAAVVGAGVAKRR
jgi:hypothetical protein